MRRVKMLKSTYTYFVARAFFNYTDYFTKYLMLGHTGGKEIAWAGESWLTDRWCDAWLFAKKGLGESFLFTAL